MSQHTTRSNHSHKLWLFDRRRFVRCFWCQKPQLFHNATVDHLVALSLGGTDDHANIVIACHRCNAARSYLQLIMGWINREAAIVIELRSDPRNLLKLRRLKRLRKLLRRHASAVEQAKEDHARSVELLSAMTKQDTPTFGA